MEVVKPLSIKNTEPLLTENIMAMIGSSLGNITQFFGLRVPRSNRLFRVFHPLTGYTKMPSITYIERKKLYADQRIYIYVGTEEADETDKTLMAGEHQAEPILIHLFVIIMTSSNRWISIIFAIRFNLELFTTKKLWAEHLPECLRFWQKIGINGPQNKSIERKREPMNIEHLSQLGGQLNREMYFEPRWTRRYSCCGLRFIRWKP